MADTATNGSLKTGGGNFDSAPYFFHEHKAEKKVAKNRFKFSFLRFYAPVFRFPPFVPFSIQGNAP